ncbi:MAG TPA: ATP-dependent DNA helicase [Candidatus Sabulitectum sp.]|nr:ATP-dependent DNA helicase [Candidatus Sabulitectum sp.]HPJ28711.1 ATP-dependent DNA helicase [Candidatus Sabulitectum sp.]HPR22322.1 ATP-dependent DNA helicase [Candidatus Sabulitectum sp.]
MSLVSLTEEAFRGRRFMEVLPGASIRDSQIEMARVAACLAEAGGVAALEAGTGVGKSLAYLIPAVLSGQASVISTATITLQDQLLDKDVPAVGRILGCDTEAAVLKGRSNYLCLRKWDLWGTRVSPGLSHWVSSGDGDTASFPGAVPGKLTGDYLDCLGSRCSRFSDCHYYRARSRASSVPLLIVNHHLLLCGIRNGDLIPQSWLLVADEAHALHKAALATLGHVLTPNLMNGVFDSVTLGSGAVEEKERYLSRARELASMIQGLLDSGSENGSVDRAALLDQLQDLADGSAELRMEMEGEENLAGASLVLSRIEKTALAVANADQGKWCTYITGRGRNGAFRCVPVNPGPLMRETLYGSFPAVLLTSATLTSGGSFAYSDSLLGIPEEAERRIFQSPFDYSRQAVLAFPEDPPDHNDHPAVAREAWRIARETSEILGGRTMVLFTSYRNMELCRDAALECPPSGIHMLVQGEMSRSTILDKFRQDPGSVILGTASFWEGVDLPGEMLQALIIDRIPFPSPGHPLTEARMKNLEELGTSSFTHLMLPEAATRLKQGTGRLIRSSVDTGAVFILDRRMKTAGYAGILLRSIPGYRRCSVPDAMDFLREQTRRSGGTTP